MGSVVDHNSVSSEVGSVGHGLDQERGVVNEKGTYLGRSIEWLKSGVKGASNSVMRGCSSVAEVVANLFSRIFGHTKAEEVITSNDRLAEEVITSNDQLKDFARTRKELEKKKERIERLKEQIKILKEPRIEKISRDKERFNLIRYKELELKKELGLEIEDILEFPDIYDSDYSIDQENPLKQPSVNNTSNQLEFPDIYHSNYSIGQTNYSIDQKNPLNQLSVNNTSNQEGKTTDKLINGFGLIEKEIEEKIEEEKSEMDKAIKELNGLKTSYTRSSVKDYKKNLKVKIKKTEGKISKLEKEIKELQEEVDEIKKKSDELKAKEKAKEETKAKARQGEL